ncbi:MAG: hypothetical protein JOZ18_16175 [Chloroflexi bacterium]|nr:hypothetical protein [Chloroflexota bacterium]
MDSDDERSEEIDETGSDELLSDDNLRLPDGANALVRLHAVRAWLARRRKETTIEIGEAALALQEVMQEESTETRLRRRERQLLAERQTQTQATLQQAQQRLSAYEEAEALLEECVSHTTSGERVLVEYYLTLDELIQRHTQGAKDASWQTAMDDVQHRVEHVTTPSAD